MKIYYIVALLVGVLLTFNLYNCSMKEGIDDNNCNKKNKTPIEQAMCNKINAEKEKKLQKKKESTLLYKVCRTYPETIEEQEKCNDNLSKFKKNLDKYKNHLDNIINYLTLNNNSNTHLGKNPDHEINIKEGFGLINECYGGCKADDWCADGLFCWMPYNTKNKDSGIAGLPIPGCMDACGNVPGIPSLSYDTKNRFNRETGYCVSENAYNTTAKINLPIPTPRAPPSIDTSISPYNMIQHCQADCENSEQCGPGLVCFNRVDENMDVPGCDNNKLQSGAKSYCVYENDVSNVQVNNWKKLGPGVFRDSSKLCDATTTCTPCKKSATGLGMTRTCTRTWSLSKDSDLKYCTIFDASSNISRRLNSDNLVQITKTTPCGENNIITIQNPITKSNSNDYGPLENNDLFNLIEKATTDVNLFIGSKGEIYDKISDYAKSLNKKIGKTAKQIHSGNLRSRGATAEFVPLFLRDVDDDQEEIDSSSVINSNSIDNSLMFKCTNDNAPACYRSNWKFNSS